MLKPAAMIFGALLVLLGLAGFVPVVTIPATDGDYGLLLGAFAVDPVQNVAHIVTGAVALGVGAWSEDASRIYFRVVGVLYALLAVVGFGVGTGTLFGMAHNTADAFLHLFFALVTLSLGFTLRPRGGSRHGHHPA